LQNVWGNSLKVKSRWLLTKFSPQAKAKSHNVHSKYAIFVINESIDLNDLLKYTNMGILGLIRDVFQIVQKKFNAIQIIGSYCYGWHH
jgi:hypothetical protein